MNDNEFQAVTLDLNVVKDKIPTFSSEKLCEMVVCDRYFGCYREVALMCMEELSNRRELGDTFDFEFRIEELFKTLPKLDFSIPNIRDVMQKFVGGKFK